VFHKKESQTHRGLQTGVHEGHRTGKKFRKTHKTLKRIELPPFYLIFWDGKFFLKFLFMFLLTLLFPPSPIFPRLY
jgi:hypothetical protein